MGVDFGMKRVGIAVSDESRGFALPLSVIANTPTLLAEILKIAVDNEVEEIVIGESRNYKGEPNPIFNDVEIFKKELELKGYKVYLEPEFMTSVQAKRFQGKHGMLDASAAALILQSYLDKVKGEQ